jgi:carboxyl-terminal processing protease
MPAAVDRRVGRSILCGLAGLATAALLVHEPTPEAPQAERGVERAALRTVAWLEPLNEVTEGSCDDGEFDRAVLLPTGAPSSLTCDDARRVVAQARATLAAPVGAIDPAKFAEATADWLDPHGMWSVAADAPPGRAVRRLAERLLAEIEAPAGSAPCLAAREVGVELKTWTTHLRALFDEGSKAESAARASTGAQAGDRRTQRDISPARREADVGSGRREADVGAGRRQADVGSGRREADVASADIWSLVSSAPFEDGAVTRSARDLALGLGRDVAAASAFFGDQLSPYAAAARERIAPALDEEGWARAVIAAAVRSYIPQLDAHGAWAPLDEEMSIYDLALEVDPPERLWSEMTRTALGVRIDRGALAPLLDGDIALGVQDVALAGISVEQAEQFAIASSSRPVRVTVLREGAPGIVELTVSPASGPPLPAAPPAPLALTLVKYADGEAAVITIPDVPDDLGPRLSSVIEEARGRADLRGVVLDVRGNGGGATDGAVGALGLFLPGASLFPMRRRDGGIELEAAPRVAEERRWSGPVGVLVDGDSASAAEMIAGALAAYHRGVVVGDRTYGKGCAQEYLDDDAHAGVLRLTTLLFSLPDGSPVQKVGVAPSIRLSLPSSAEREAMVPRALGPWRGPDVRDAARIREVPWPSHAGRVGPCVDEIVCRALRALGAAPAAAR